jgi:hypothetical protein
MGYEFFENKVGWKESTYRSLRPVHVVVLDMQKNGERASRYCLERAGEGIQKFAFIDTFPKIRVVRGL